MWRKHQRRQNHDGDVLTKAEMILSPRCWTKRHAYSFRKWLHRTAQLSSEFDDSNNELSQLLTTSSTLSLARIWHWDFGSWMRALLHDSPLSSLTLHHTVQVRREPQRSYTATGLRWLSGTLLEDGWGLNARSTEATEHELRTHSNIELEQKIDHLALLSTVSNQTFIKAPRPFLPTNHSPLWQWLLSYDSREPNLFHPPIRSPHVRSSDDPSPEAAGERDRRTDHRYPSVDEGYSTVLYRCNKGHKNFVLEVHMSCFINSKAESDARCREVKVAFGSGLGWRNRQGRSLTSLGSWGLGSGSLARPSSLLLLCFGIKLTFNARNRQSHTYVAIVLRCSQTRATGASVLQSLRSSKCIKLLSMHF